MSIDRALSILGVLTGVYFYLKSRSIKRLDVTFKVAWLQSRRHPEIKIYFREEEVENLSRVRILFSNTGTLPLRPKEDFSSRFANGLRISAADASTKILSAAILGGDANVGAAIARSADGSNAVVSFEYLNPRHRIAAEVLFTGPKPVVEVDIVGGSIRQRTMTADFETGGDADMAAFLFGFIGYVYLVSQLEVLKPYPGYFIAVSLFVAIAVAFLARQWRRRSKRRSGIAFLEGWS